MPGNRIQNQSIPETEEKPEKSVVNPEDSRNPVSIDHVYTEDEAENYSNLPYSKELSPDAVQPE